MSLDKIKTIPQYLVPHHVLNAFAACVADVTNVRVKNFIIQRFIKTYQVNMAEALNEDPCSYPCFNEFFIRKLKPECRPLAHAGVISPVDGCVSEIGSVENGQLLQAKGRLYSVAELLACEKEYADTFSQGRFATLYLSPKDYHRVHLPMDAELVSMTYIPGTLFSVQPSTVRVVPNLFARNERLVISFATKVGPMVMVLVGAAVVGAIGTSWEGELHGIKAKKVFNYTKQFFHQGDELGYFKLGSTVILMFAHNESIHWKPNLQAGSGIRFGQALGDIF
ncbi:MAG: archaetidylserine decarboxylase [Legionella sp.]|jgi:phosphatidylserine decarboxylase